LRLLIFEVLYRIAVNWGRFYPSLLLFPRKISMKNRKGLFATVLTLSALTTGLWTSFAATSRAQVVPSVPTIPGITASGNGIIMVPADSAVVVLSYYLNYMPTEESASNPYATPPPVKPGDYQPIVEAMKAAGADDVQATIDPAAPQGVRMRFTMVQPSVEKITQILTAANAAATKNNKFSGAGVSVGLTVKDCAATEARVRQLAIADLRRRAEGLATTAGSQLGNMTALMDITAWGNAYYSGACPSTDSNPYADFYSMPGYDFTAGTNLRVMNQMTATFEMKKR
jgi:hypothetical protein